MVNHGMLVLWITLNPLDLRSPLVLKLAGVCLDASGRNKAALDIHAATATMNPVAVAKFFAATCRGIFEHLLAAGATDDGFLVLYQRTLAQWKLMAVVCCICTVLCGFRRHFIYRLCGTVC